MSHITTIKTKITDLDALKEACKSLGLVFKENQKNYKWYGRSVGDYPLPLGFKESDLGKCDHAISLKNNKDAYEIGLVKRGDEYVMVWDFWNGGYGLEKVVGKDCENLTDSYTNYKGINETKIMAKEYGMTWSSYIDNETGETVVKLRGY